MGMNLEIVEVTGECTGGFDIPDGYRFEHHWQYEASRGLNESDGYRQFKVMDTDSGKEVARFELDGTAERRNFICSTYPIPSVGSPLLEIQFIDVLDSFKGRGIGRWIVEQLEKENPEFQLLALAEESEGFWKSLGWTQILPEEKNRREMYMSLISKDN